MIILQAARLENLDPTAPEILVTEAPKAKYRSAPKPPYKKKNAQRGPRERGPKGRRITGPGSSKADERLFSPDHGEQRRIGTAFYDTPYYPSAPPIQGRHLFRERTPRRRIGAERASLAIPMIEDRAACTHHHLFAPNSSKRRCSTQLQPPWDPHLSPTSASTPV